MTILDIMAVSSSTFRVYVRWRLSKLWWDDYLVSVPLAVDFYYMVTLWATRLMTSTDS